jgi:hypothetical protein
VISFVASRLRLWPPGRLVEENHMDADHDITNGESDLSQPISGVNRQVRVANLGGGK